MTRHPLPSTGSSMDTECPCFVGTIRCYDFLPSVPPHFVAFAWRYHRCTLISLPAVRHATPKAGGFCCSRRWPPIGCFGGNDRTSHVPREPPLCLCPALRPRQDREYQLGHRGIHNTAPAQSTTRAPTINHFRGSITRPRHSLSTLRRMDYSTTTQDSLPVACQALPDGLLPAGFLQKVSEFNYISSSFPELS